jgi:peptidoglycan/xylan/chitin deacetylase (PgdA/CDA1 family)
MPTLRKIPCALARFLRPVSVVALALLFAAATVTAAAAGGATPARGVVAGAAPARPAEVGRGSTRDDAHVRKPRARPTTAHLSQAGRDLILSVRTSRPVALGALQPRPDTRRAAARYLCFGFAAGGASAGDSAAAGDGAAAGDANGRDNAGAGGDTGAGERRLCLGGPKAHKRAGLVTVDAAGKPIAGSAVAARLKRPDPDKLVLTLDPAAAGLRPGHFGWRVLESGGCAVRRKCAATLPARGSLAFRLRPVRAVGCAGGLGGLITNGPREGHDVALTFDDGPSEYTDRYLDVLKEKGVHATFFEIGQEMPGREATMRRILGEGDEIGDHTMNHVEYPGYSQIAGAQTRIEEYTGFKPCLFRQPGGAVNSSVVSTAAELGMDTITWDVDPQDWSLPGTDAIYSNIVGNAQAGSIILMHDGGGPRDETLVALPHIIDTLRAKGYGFETVSALLGDKIAYRPYG